MRPVELSEHGTVWGYTVQRFAPKSPPYVPPADGFAPFAVGYVELPEGVKVEAVIDCVDFDDLDGRRPGTPGRDRAGAPVRRRVARTGRQEVEA